MRKETQIEVKPRNHKPGNFPLLSIKLLFHVIHNTEGGYNLEQKKLIISTRAWPTISFWYMGQINTQQRRFKQTVSVKSLNQLRLSNNMVAYAAAFQISHYSPKLRRNTFLREDICKDDHSSKYNYSFHISLSCINTLAS